GNDLAARSRLHRAFDRRALSARRTLPHLRRLCRPLPAGLGGLDARHRRDRGSMNAIMGETIMSEARAKDEARTRVDRALRVLLPIAVLALGVVVWELLVHLGNIPPYVLPNPRLVFSTLISDWAVLGASLLVTLTTTLEGFLLAAAGGVGLAVLFNQ